MSANNGNNNLGAFDVIHLKKNIQSVFQNNALVIFLLMHCMFIKEYTVDTEKEKEMINYIFINQSMYLPFRYICFSPGN